MTGPGGDPVSLDGQSDPAGEAPGDRPDRGHGADGRGGWKRSDVHGGATVDGGDVATGRVARLRAAARQALTSQAQRDEATVESGLHQRRGAGVTRTNTIAVLSPKGGPGKSACTYELANVLSAYLNLKCLAIDANPDLGTLGALPGEPHNNTRHLADLLAAMRADQVNSATEVEAFASRVPSGLHVLAAPDDPELMEQMTPDVYGELTALMSKYYNVLVLDCGTQVVGPIARWVFARADQAVLVTEPSWQATSKVITTIELLEGEPLRDHLTVVINRAPPELAGEVAAIRTRLHAEELRRVITIPQDWQLYKMLDSGTYSLEALDPETRLPIKELGLAVAEQLV